MTFAPNRIFPLALISVSVAFSSFSDAAPRRSSKQPAPVSEPSPPEDAVESEELSDEGYDEELEESPRDQAPSRMEIEVSSPRNTWLSLGIAGDIAWVSGKNVCTFESQVDNGYSCFRDGDNGKLEQYFGAPVYGEENSISPGFRLRTGRVLLGLDQVVGSNFTLGARLGFAFNGGPKGHNDARGFLPLHLEGRLAYWFGDEVFTKTGFRPYVFAAGGLAQVDSRARVRVVEDDRPSHQPDNEESQVLVVYKKMGQGFVGLGGGVLYALGENSGIVVELKAMMMFPSSGQVLEPTIGYAFGL